MKIGMNLLLWTDRPALREHASLLPKIRAWGFDGVEFPVENIQVGELAEWARRCDGEGLARTTILALPANLADPASADEALRRAAVREIGAAAARTRELGASLMAGPLFQGLGRFSGAGPTADEWKWAVDTLREAGERAAALGVRLALEPLNRFEMYLVNTLADGARFVRDVGLANVGLLADTHHGHIEEAALVPAWREAWEHIFHVHISENHRGTPGSGHAIPPDLFDFLRETGYMDWVTIEAFNPAVRGLASRLHLWRPLYEREDEPAREGCAFIRGQLARSTGG